MARRSRKSSGNGGAIMYLILFGVIIYLLLPKLQATTTEEMKKQEKEEEMTEKYDAVAVISGNVQYSPAPDLQNNKNFKQAISDVFYQTEEGEQPNIVVFSAAGNPKTIEIKERYLLSPAANSLASESNLKDLIKGIEQAANTPPTSSGADYFAALIEALNYVKQFDNPLIIMYGSGLSDTGIFNFALGNLIRDDAKEFETVNQILTNDKRFANEDFSNVTIYCYGIGQTVGKHQDLKEWKKSVENTYKAIFDHFNIVYVFYPVNITANTKSVPTEFKVNETTLPTLEENYELSLNERYLAFVADQAVLINEPEVRELLKGVAFKIKATPDIKIKLTGYQTVCAKSKELSVQRAETVKRILVELGVEADRITTDGVAGPPDNREENPRCGYTGVAVEHRTVILETYK